MGTELADRGAGSRETCLRQRDGDAAAAPRPVRLGLYWFRISVLCILFAQVVADVWKAPRTSTMFWIGILVVISGLCWLGSELTGLAYAWRHSRDRT